MKGKWLSTVLAVIGTVCFLFTSCRENENNSLGDNSYIEQGEPNTQTDEEKIRATIAKFVKVYNDGDFDGFLSCLEPKLRNTTRALFNTLGGITGGLLGVDISFSDLFTLGIGTQGASDTISVEIEKIEIGVNGTRVTTKTTFAGDCATTYFLMAKENDEWLIADITEKKPSITPLTGMVIERCLDFKGGLALISYALNGESYSGFLDKNGRIVYTLNKEREFLVGWEYMMGDGSIILKEYDENNQEICKKVINNKGKEVARYESDIFDGVIRLGDKHAVLYKKYDGINGIYYTYGIIDSMGNWIMPMQKIEGISNSSKAGGIFYGEDFLLLGGELLYSLKTNKQIRVYADKPISELIQEMRNGCLYIRKSTFFQYSDGTNTVNVEDAYFSIDANLSMQGIEVDASFADITGDYCVYENKENGNTVFYNIITQEKMEYTEYREMEKTFTWVGDYFLVEIEGLNGKGYFTLIDVNGVQQFEPIEKSKYCACVYSEGFIAYKDNINSVGGYIVDIKGNTVIGDQYKILYPFYNGIAVAIVNETEEIVFINTKGEPAFENYYINE